MNQQNLIKTIVQAIRQSEPKTKAYDTQARVTRIDGSTAWVHIPGGVAETPVKLTIAAKAGDTVQVRVSGGRAFLVGNSSAPPTDDRVAKEAVKQVGVVKKTLTVVKEVAEKAQRIAGNTNQYFWHVESGTDTGAHITEIPQDEFLADPEHGGGNLLARSNGIALRDGLTELAAFYSNGIQIGSATETRILLDTTNGLKLGNAIQLRPDGSATFTGTITGSSGAFTKGFDVSVDVGNTAKFNVNVSSSGVHIGTDGQDGMSQAYTNYNISSIDMVAYRNIAITSYRGGLTLTSGSTAKMQFVSEGEGFNFKGSIVGTYTGTATSHQLLFGTEWDDKSSIIHTYWADGGRHNWLERSTDGLTTYVGWIGSSTYPTVAQIRSQDIQFRSSKGTVSVKNLYKDPGDTWSVTFFGAGYVTDSGKQWRFSVPLPNIASGTLSITSMTNFFGRAATGGTIVNGVTIATSNINVARYHGFAQVTVTFATAPSGYVNNAPCGIQCNITFKLE